MTIIAEREKNARVTYGESEILVAKKFEEASAVYSDNPIAYALRQSNMLYESIKVQGNTIVMVPSESLNSMGFGNLATTVAYLENTNRAAKSSQTQFESPQNSIRVKPIPPDIRRLRISVKSCNSAHFSHISLFTRIGGCDLKYCI